MAIKKILSLFVLFAKTSYSQVNVSKETEYNLKVINQLKQEGDKLAKLRVVEHFLYFKTEEGRSQFIEYAKANKYTIGPLKIYESGDEKFPFFVQISKLNDVQLETMNKITASLKEVAQKYSGDYDGWGSSVEK